MEASQTVIQAAMVTHPRQSKGRLPPKKNGLGPNQYRGLSSEVPGAHAAAQADSIPASRTR